ncbi:MAG: TonB-dependent receptor [Hyphomonadaceae bacterium]|nr:TonB-dependent receptor [Hyphomonadaceae bacterium]
MAKRDILCSAFTMASLFCVATGGAFAQSDDQGGVDELVVTAQKREESAQDVPIAITALSARAIEDQQMLTMESLQGVVPNLYMGQALSGNTTPKMFLRGIGVDNQVFSFDSPIGLYVDGVYRARTTGALSDFFDVERVEMLRGPQGTLYGRNSSVGALNIIHPAPPLDRARVRAEVAVGSVEQRDARLSVGAPLVEGRVGADLSIVRRQNDGWMRNVTTGEQALDEDITALRGALLFNLNDSVSLTLRGDAMWDFSQGAQATLYNPGVFGDDPDNDPYTYEASPESGKVNKVIPWGASAALEADIGSASLTSITAYRRLTFRNANDVDGYAAFRTFEVDRQDLNESQFSQEVFLTGDHIGGAPIQWTSGIFYFHEDNEFYWGLRVLDFILGPPATSHFDQETNSAAIYAQADFPVSERLTGTLGARYTWEEKDFRGEQFLPNGGGLDPSFQFNGVASTYRTTWHAALNYEVTDDAILYINSGTGFRSGGFNGNATTVADITSGAFGPEKTFITELGAKTEWFSRRLRLNVDYYYAEYTDMQQAIVDGNGQVTTSNAQATADGIELELTAVPVDGLEVFGSLGTVNFEFEGSPFGQRDTPETVGRLGAIYTFDIGAEGGSLSFGGDVNYQSTYFFDPVTPDTYVDPVYVYDAHITYETSGEKWRVTLAGYNLTDEYYPNHAFHIGPTGSPIDSLVAHVQFPNLPRRWLLTLGYRY